MGGKTAINLTGQRFGRFEVLARAESDRHGNAKWNCRCDCGALRTVLAQSLRCGATQSCGCLNRDIKAANAKHGMSATREYKAWAGMVQRCTNPKNEKWPRYGARGISVCTRWLSYENFLADMGPRPEGMTIDRENNDGNYEPGNCRWATHREQANNRGNNVLVTVGDEVVTASQASARLGADRSLVGRRLRDGWDPARATSEPTNNTKELT